MTDVSSLSRRERRVAETRAALVEAASGLFRSKGFDETTIDEIAERADVAQRTFFRYFPTKEAVLFADFEDLHATLLVALAGRPLDEPPLVSLYEALHSYVCEVQARFDTLAWVVETAERCSGFGVEGAVLRLRMTENLAQTLAERLGTDHRVDPRPAAWAGLMLSCFGAAMKISLRSHADLAATFDELIADTVAGLGEIPVGRVRSAAPPAPASPPAGGQTPTPQSRNFAR